MERIWVPVVGTVAVMAFVLVELTGSGADEHIAQAAGTAAGVALLTIIGLAGIGFARLQPRFALLGVVTAMLSLLTFGAVVVAIWNQGIFGFGFGLAPSARVAWITILLTIAAAASCALLATTRPDDAGGVKVVRFAGVAALAIFIGLAILAIADPSVHIGDRVYAYLATVYVVASALLIFVRLLPDSRTT